MPVAEHIEQKTKHSDLANKSVCLIVNTSSIGNTRKVHTANIEIQADKDYIRVQKQLLDSPELKAIKSLDGEIRRWIYSRSSESPFTSGVYLLATALVPQVEEKLTEFSTQRESLISEFVKAYPALIEKARQDLDGVFNIHDYPKVSQVAGMFGMDWQYWSFATPDTLNEISPAFFQQQAAKAEAKWSEASDTIQAALREGFAGLVDKMCDRLSNDGGKPKIFRDSLVSNLHDFLEVFKHRNLTDDAALDSLVNQARKLVSGVSPEDLRKQEGTRDAVLHGFEKIKKNLDSMLQDKPSRKIDLE